jgi:molecular chaperone GrpE
MEKEDLKEEVTEENITEETESSQSETEEVEGLEKDQAEDEKIKSELEEMKNSKLRLQADFENYKRRVEKEKQSLISYAVEDMMCELLPVIDNFDRALEINDTENFKGFYDGVEMIKKQLLDALKKQGLEEIEAEGKPFDPNYHNAVLQQESEEYDSETVIQVYQKGYMIKEKVIRPSMVVVSK